MLSHLANQNITTFKGYDACPVRNIYMQGIISEGQRKIYQEIKEIGEKEGFSTLYYNGIDKISSDNKPNSLKFFPRWAQDDKMFLEGSDSQKVACHKDFITRNYSFAKQLGMHLTSSDYFAAGGNVFIGKKPNGDKWMLVGMSENGANNLDEFSKFYGVKPENIHFLTQPNFHLDMSIRPIGYPYVLVNDEKLVKERVKDEPELKEKVDTYYNQLHLLHRFSPVVYTDADDTVEELERAGFVPIRIAGVYGDDINYMNAIVNKHKDGSMAYITNSSKWSDFEKTDKMFQEDLKRLFPDVSDIYFVSGGLDEKMSNTNAMMFHLGKLHGGLHCMTLEEPDFSTWA